MTTVDIKGRDLASATGSTGPVNFSPINLGLGAGAFSSSGSGGLSPISILAVVILAIAAVFLVG